jgi:hypothetical protein
LGDNPPPTNQTIDEIFFGIIDTLCRRYQGLTPFVVLNTPTNEVLNVWTDMILYDRNNKDQDEQNGKQKADRIEWVTSKNATWH